MSDRYHLRRADREIEEPDRIDGILLRGRYATFALVDESDPYVVTLSYGYDFSARRMYFHVAHEGHKLDVITRHPEVCGTVVIDHGYNQGECEHPFESVVMRGSMRVVSSAEEKRHAIHTLVTHLENDPDTYWSSRSWRLEQRLDGFTALCFEIESMTAKEGK